MKISVISLFPELYEPFFNTSIVRRAHEQHHVVFNTQSLFKYAEPKERIDAPTFGHGAGMLLRPETVEKAIKEQEEIHGSAYKIFFSPHGTKLDQVLLRDLYAKLQNNEHLMLLPARYEGMDARVEDYYADAIISLGDFVLMGGDLPAMVLIEGILRLIPGVIGKAASVEHESFSGPFVDYPEYTEPVVWRGYEVPAILRSGNHKKIEQWRKEQAVRRTVLKHFQWLRSHITSIDDIKLVQLHIPEHYVILMHDQVLMQSGNEGTSSVTSIDIHDIARSACTYGIKKYIIVTPLADQQRIVRKLLDFWHTHEGIEYNRHRHEALARVLLVSTFDEALAEIEKYAQAKPLLIATAARLQQSDNMITYYDQEKVWLHLRPVALIFGTARGLGSSIIKQCDFILEPIEGFSLFNHLSVRSAAAIIFDRWLGINRIASLKSMKKHE